MDKRIVITPYSVDELYHYGILGMKWGVRRFQNKDGTRTAAGKKRYSGQPDYSKDDNKLIRKFAKSSLTGMNHLRSYRVKRFEAAIKKNKEKGKDTKVLEERLKAQKKANENLKEYYKHTSTKKLLLQQFLLGTNADWYRHARARGEERVVSSIEGGLGVMLLGPLGGLIEIGSRVINDREAYGKVTWSDNTEGSIF